MTKDEVAEMLQVSTRQVERYTKSGELGVTYEKGKTRKIPVYDKREVAALKARLENVTHHPAVVREDRETTSQSLVRASDAAPMESIALALKILSERQPAPEKRPSVSPADKLVLKISEASQLTGFSYHFLREAVKDGRLKAQLIGRAYRIKRADLDEFIKRL